MWHMEPQRLMIWSQHNRAQTTYKIHRLTHLPLDKVAAILADDIFKRIFLNENVGILIQISLKFVPKGSIDN